MKLEHVMKNKKLSYVAAGIALVAISASAVYVPDSKQLQAVISINPSPQIVSPAPSQIPVLMNTKCNGSPNPAYLSGNGASKEVDVTWTTSESGLAYFWSFGDVGTSFTKTAIATYKTAGIKTANLSVTYGVDWSKVYSCSIEVKEPQPDQPNQINQPDTIPLTLPSPSPTPNPSPGSPPAPSPSPNPSPAPSPPPSPIQQQSNLKPSENIMTCKAGGDVLNRATEQPIYVHCGFTQSAIVNAFVTKGDYDPKQNTAEVAIVKQFLTDEPQPAQTLVITWSGINDYDSAVENGEYTLVVSAVPSKLYEPDYSILKFTVTDAPLPQPTQEEITTTNAQTEVTGSDTQPTSHSADEEEQAPPEPSKCPGVNYPTDIKNHWAENFIKTSYDECLLTGYRDGTFRPDQDITRAESVKLVMAANSIQPKVCFDNDCGSPYTDLDTWQGPWVRPAWDIKVAEKTGTKFEPNRPITRAEAASVVVKGFKFPIPAFCYTANCGAGFPDNFFIDIKQAWQGPYIRSLWDKKVVQGTEPGMFEPNRPITRAELTKMVVSSRGAVKEANPPSTQTPPSAPTPQPATTEATQTSMQSNSSQQ